MQRDQLEDFISFVSPLMGLVDTFGAEKQVTASIVIPKLITACNEIEVLVRRFAAVPGKEYVAAWHALFFGERWEAYIDEFLHSKKLLASTLLDIRLGWEVLPKELLEEAIAALYELTAEATPPPPLSQAPSPTSARVFLSPLSVASSIVTQYSHNMLLKQNQQQALRQQTTLLS